MGIGTLRRHYKPAGSQALPVDPAAQMAAELELERARNAALAAEVAALRAGPAPEGVQDATPPAPAVDEESAQAVLSPPPTRPQGRRGR